MFTKLLLLAITTLNVLQTSVYASSTDHFPTILDQSAMKDGQEGRAAVDPCEDFYQFACGTWLDESVIPADKKAVYRQSTALDEDTDLKLYKILNAYAQGDYSLNSTYAKKLGDYFKSCTDVETSAAQSLAYVKDVVKKFSLASDKKETAKLLAKLNLYGVGSFFNIYSTQSLKDSSKVIADVSQGGFVLTEREYYFDQDAKSIEIRKHYHDYIAQLFSLFGYDSARAKNAADDVLKIETSLADKAYIAADRNDPSKTNHPIGRSGLQRLMPHFDWSTYLAGSGLPAQQEINVDEPEFFANADLVISKLKKLDLETYLTWLWLNRTAENLGGQFEQAHFDFWKSYMNGSKKMLPRWKLCTQQTASHMGYALAEAYVKTVDANTIKAKAANFISIIKDTFKRDLADLATGPDAWLDDATIQEAAKKIEAMGSKLGAPETFRNYDSLQTTPANYLTNNLQITLFESLRDFAKIGKPVDKSEWGMMPWEINAYYDRSNNEFVFPFGILQPPSFDLSASDGANLGAFGGGTIGHELTHGFDNNGSQYDSKGNLRNWWTARTSELFKQKAQCFVDQANHYTVRDVNLTVDGAQTLEENLADQGGVKLGYLALENILKSRPESPAWAGRYNERQQYWIGYAQSWCTKMTPEALRFQMTGDEHPPAEFRVNAVLMNISSFAKDFNCPVNKPMAPANRCQIW